MALKWLEKMTGPDDQTETPHWHEPVGMDKLTLRNLFFSNDYRMMGLKHILTSMVFFAVGGMAALLMRTELAAPGETIMSANAYYRLMTAHGMTMVFAWIIPVMLGLGYFFLPPLLKTDHIKLPKLAHASYWLTVVAAVLIWAARSDASWTFYPPVGLRVGGGLQPLFFLAIVAVALSELLAAYVFVYNVVKNRNVPWSKMPLLGWAMLSTGIIMLVAVPALLATGVMMLTDWYQLTAFFDAARGGSPRLFMFVFWWYGHPAVYLPFVPAIGVVYTILPRFLKRPVWSYKSSLLAFAGLTALGFEVFHHHFFWSVTPHTWFERTFSLFTLLIIIPSSMHIFNWTATIWGGAPEQGRRAIPFKFTLGAIALAIYGGVAGFVNAQMPTNMAFVHDTYWVIGHFHALFLGFMTQMAFAGFYYLYPYVTGRKLNQALANAHFWLWQVGIWTLTTMFYILGLMGMPRRVYDFFSFQTVPNFIATIGAFLVGCGLIAFVYNAYRSATAGEVVQGDPWRVEEDVPVTRPAVPQRPAAQPTVGGGH